MASPLTGEYQFGVGSLVCGYDTVAPEVSIVKISGLGPSVIAQTANRAFSPGAAVGVDTSGPRMVELDVEIFTPGDDEDAGGLVGFVGHRVRRQRHPHPGVVVRLVAGARAP
ncbi:MAG: hypothetical protein IPJ47_16590 [Anaerolineales bacterium]|nr:hypothetical protein [Anaerolineales bacterium]